MEKETSEKKRPAETSYNPVTEGRLGREILFYMIPIVLSSLFQQLYNTVDAIVVGQFIGKEALGAVNSTGSITRLLIFFFVGLSAGATILISHMLGGKKHVETEEAVHTAAAFALLGGLFVSLAGILLAPLLLRAVRMPDENFDLALSYIRIFFAGAVFTVIYNMGAGILKCAGDSKRSFYFLLASSTVNIVLDLLFVPILGLGVAGAAWATVIGQMVSALLVVHALMTAKTDYRLIPGKLRIRFPLLREMLRMGLPRGIQSSLFSFSNVLLISGVNSLGADVMAAFAVEEKLEILVWLFVESVSVSATTFVGQNFGAGNRKRMFRSVHICILYGFMIFIPISLLLYFGGGVLGRMFTSDETVLQLAVYALHLAAPFYWVVIFTEVFSGAIQGTGETLKPMLITFFSVCVLRILWMLIIFPLIPEFGTIVISYPVTWVTAAAASAVYYKCGAWRKRTAENR